MTGPQILAGLNQDSCCPLLGDLVQRAPPNARPPQAWSTPGGQVSARQPKWANTVRFSIAQSYRIQFLLL